MTSILLPEFRGVMHVSGYRGLGKTMFSHQADLPQNIKVFDYEHKGEGIANQLQIGSYSSIAVDATVPGQTEPNPLLLFDRSIEAFSSLEKDRFPVVIIDNVSPLEQAIKSEGIRNVDKYCSVFGLNKKNVLAGRYGGANSIMNFYISEIVKMLHSRGVKLIIVTSHISSKWHQGVPLHNKYTVKGGNKWSELSILSLILVPGAYAPIPAAHVVKEQLGKISINDNPTAEEISAMMRGEIGHDVQRRLPYRLPKCTFQEIRRYLHSPVDFNDLEHGEQPLQDEINPFSDVLSKEQFSLLEKSLEVHQMEEAAAEKDAIEAVQQIQKQKTEAIAVEVNNLLDNGFEPAEVAQKLNIKLIDVAKLRSK